ncbi:phosphoglycolate phosphatase [Faunimonas pinastri]|uniref:phosphoglycolate phosphatase n=1 Tax=Faunimonas pinastri TaxID=1855383 RepID=A0A1H9HRS5_9HYPH|nr:HAD hydrolase-like protein [Faunimonas pinastri]SEQ64958.1 phosphoglycolate phosphatase [Faunimonas pinastri]
MSHFDVFLFDYDGTLAATRNAVVECLSRTLGERGFVASPAEIAAVVASGVPLEGAFAALLPEEARTDADECVRRYREHYPEVDRERSGLFDGAAETLAALRAAGGRIVVLSNKGRVAIEAALERFGLQDTVDAVLAADPGAPVKPDPAVFARRVSPLFRDLPSQAFVMVGDTSADIGFAQAAGIASCWARYGYGDGAACLAMKPDFIIGALPEMLSLQAPASRDALPDRRTP